MNTILHIDSSIFSTGGVSAALAGELVSRLRAGRSDVRVIHRDLGRDPIPHLDGERIAAIAAAPDQRTPEQQDIARQADGLIEELQQADLVVLGVPMYNFSVPSQLKAWFDHVARAGVTFRYTEAGPEGLLKGKQAVVVTSRGGLHKGAASDTQTPFVRTFLALLGITDVEFVYAEGLNLGEEQRRGAIDEATAHLERLLEARLLAA